MTNTLELLPDIEFGIIQVDLFPGQAEDFTPAETEDEDQDEGGVEGFACVPG